MNTEVSQSHKHWPKYPLIGRSNDAGKPTGLKKNKVPKFSHQTNPIKPKKKATADWQWPFVWWRIRDLNPGPADYDSVALTS